MARTHARARIGVRKPAPTDEDLARMTEAMLQCAPEVKEITESILAQIKKLADIEKRLKAECPGAK
jgi:hypothetical protein